MRAPVRSKVKKKAVVKAKPAKVKALARAKVAAPKLTAKLAAKAKAPTKPKARAKAKPVTKPKPLSPEMLKFREQLLTELTRLETELDEIERRTARMDESDRATEMSAYEDHPADLASITFEREKDLAIGESVENLLHKVIGALEKIERGTFGLCDACGRPIKKARLNALPFATLCLECQDRLER